MGPVQHVIRQQVVTTMCVTGSLVHPEGVNTCVNESTPRG